MDITGEDIYTYTTGACYDLALAIHETTGWPLELAQTYGDEWLESDVEEWGVPIRPDHAYVVMPCGLNLDIRGASDIPSQWGAVRTARVEPEQVDALRWRSNDARRTYALAAYLVADHRADCEGCR